MSIEPRISVIIPLYNAETLIEETLATVLQQSFSDFEIIVVDNNSTDQSAELVKKFAARDPRIMLLSESNQGTSYARNKGITRARGELITFLDADDLWHPKRLAIHEQLHSKEPQLLLSFDEIEIVDEEGRSTGFVNRKNILKPTLLDLFLNFPVGNGSSFMINSRFKQALTENHINYYFDASLTGSEEAEFVIRLYLCSKIAEPFRGIPLPLTRYRMLPGSLSRNGKMMVRDSKLMCEKLQQLFPKRVSKSMCRIYPANAARFIGRQSLLDGRVLNSVRYFGLALWLSPSTLVRDPKKWLMIFTGIFVRVFFGRKPFRYILSRINNIALRSLV